MSGENTKEKKMKYSKARKIRKELGLKCPCAFPWENKKGSWRWTLFAVNGRVQDSSSESFSSKRNAQENYNQTHWLMREVGYLV